MAHLWHGEARADVVVGADGINSMVRTSLWGEIPIREHNLHIFGGFAGSSQKAVEPRAASERPGSVALRRVGLVVGALGLAG